MMFVWVVSLQYKSKHFDGPSCVQFYIKIKNKLSKIKDEDINTNINFGILNNMITVLKNEKTKIVIFFYTFHKLIYIYD